MWNEPDRVRRDGPGGKRREDVRTLDGSSAIDLRLPPRLLGAYPYVAAPGASYDRAWPFGIRIDEKEVGVPATRISGIVAGRRSITADTDLRRRRFFGPSEGYWLRAQVAHDTEVALERLAAERDKTRPWAAA